MHNIQVAFYTATSMGTLLGVTRESARGHSTRYCRVTLRTELFRHFQEQSSETTQYISHGSMIFQPPPLQGQAIVQICILAHIRRALSQSHLHPPRQIRTQSDPPPQLSVFHLAPGKVRERSCRPQHPPLRPCEWPSGRGPNSR